MPKEGCGNKASRCYFDRTLSQSSVTGVWELPHLSVVSMHPVTHNDLCSVSLSWSPMQTCSIASVLCREPCCSTAYWARAVMCGRVDVLGWGYFSRKKNQKSFHPPKPKKPKLASKWDKKKNTFTQVLGIQHLLCWTVYGLMMMYMRGKIQLLIMWEYLAAVGEWEFF